MLSARLSLSVLQAPDGQLLNDFTGRAMGLRIGKNAHGCAYATWAIASSLEEAAQLYGQLAGRHVQISANGHKVWAGRIEDRQIVADGIELASFGYQNSLRDVPYTAFWSKTSTADWEAVPESAAGANPNMYSMDNNNRLFIGLEKNATYANNADTAAWSWEVPSGSATQIKRISFDYSFTLPAVNRRMRVAVLNRDRTSAVSYDTTLNGSGSGSFSQDVSANPRDRIEIQLYNISGAPTTYAGETGANFLNITNLRLTASGATIAADEIAKALVTYVNSVNANQILASVPLVQAPGLDLRDEIYQDIYPADVLNYLTTLGDTQTPPRVWEWGVDAFQALYFRPRGSGRRLYIDIGEPSVSASLDNLFNSAYASYQDASGDTIRSTAATDLISASRNGLVRRRAVPTFTTNSTQAGVHRDTAVSDGKDPRPRATIDVAHVFAENGGRVHPFMVDPGDVVSIRNIGPAVSSAVDRYRTFVVAETEYDADTGILSLTPESSALSLDVIVAQTKYRPLGYMGARRLQGQTVLTVGHYT